MSKYANAGELRTPVVFKRLVLDENDSNIEIEESVFGEDKPVMCKWVNTHGSEVFTARQLLLRSPATLTLRYSSVLDDVKLIVYRVGDPLPYEVISVDNVEQRNAWLEITVQRRIAAR